MGITQNPTNAQQTAQFNLIRTGGELDSYGQDGYLWASGLSEAEIEKILLYKFQGKDGRYFMHTFMRFFGARSFPGYQQDHEWREMGKTREATTITTLETAVGAATIDVKTGRTELYHQVNDVLNQTNGISAIVTAAVIDAGEEMLTLAKHDGTVWAAGEIAAARVLGHSHNIWGEQTGQPAGRTWRPEPKSNKYGIVKGTSKHSGDALTTKTELDLPGGSSVWVTENQYITMMEFARDRENMLMWSRESAAGAAVNAPRGIVRDIEANSTAVTNYATAVDEADIQAQLLLFNTLNDNDEFMVLAGQKFYYDLTNALREYFLDGAVNYGEFNSKKNLAVGLGVSQYKYGSKVLDLTEYKGFNSIDDTGAPVAVSATDTDYRDFALFINMGDNAGFDREGRQRMPYLSYKYKAIGGVDRSFVVGHRRGMTGLSSALSGAGLNELSGDIRSLALANPVATDVDADEFFMLSQMSPRLACVDTAHGYMRRTS